MKALNQANLNQQYSEVQAEYDATEKAIAN